jgi:hypothetical protein
VNWSTKLRGIGKISPEEVTRLITLLNLRKITLAVVIQGEAKQ